MLPFSDYAWTEQLVSTFAGVYFKDVLAPLESICYLGPHAWCIKENEKKQARQKHKTKRMEEKQNKKQQQQQQKSAQSIHGNASRKPLCGSNNCMFWAMTEAEGEFGYP